METLNTQRQLRKSFATYPTGIAFTAVITDGSPAGMLTSSFTSVSLDPPLVAVSFDKKIQNVAADPKGRKRRY